MTAPTKAINDERLIQNTLQGDDEAFAELVCRYKQKVFSIATRFARNHHEVDDICQEIFVKAYRNLSRFRGDAPFEHWISRIAVRMCYDFLRKTRRHRENVSLEAFAGVIQDPSWENNVSSEQAHEILNYALSKLSADERLIITLFELAEKSVREVSRLTGWSESTVKVRAFRARNALKKVLEASGER